MKLDIVTLKSCEKELDEFPQQIMEEMLDLLALLKQGLKLAMPTSRPMPTIYSGCHELRIKDKTGAYRVIYFIKVEDAIYLIHAFKKKTEKTPQREIDLAKKRIKDIL